MRQKYLSIVVCSVAVIFVTSASVTGQQEPLPVVTPRQSADLSPAAAQATAPAVYLISDPIRDYVPPTLEEAARSNDYVTFDALYREARQRGEDVSRFATLHELWTWAIGDPIGAFYGRDLYRRFARAYPGYAAYIADYAITDSNGNTFWPTSETRAFLLARATAGDVPRMQLAEAENTPASTRPAPVPAARKTAAKAPVETPAPAVDVAPPAAILQAEPAPAIAEQPAEAAPAPAPAVTPAPPVAVPAVAAAPAPAPAVARRDNALASRGILLLVLGLIGVGLLAVIFRTPKEEDTALDAAPRANVEPIRRPAAAPEAEKPRATGSHG